MHLPALGVAIPALVITGISSGHSVLHAHRLGQDGPKFFRQLQFLFYVNNLKHRQESERERQQYSINKSNIPSGPIKQRQPQSYSRNDMYTVFIQFINRKY